MNNSQIENLNQNRDPKQGLKPPQLWLSVYTLLYFMCCKWKVTPIHSIKLPMTLLLIMTAAAAVFSAAVLIYNRKYETRRGIRRYCAGLALCQLLSFCFLMTIYV